MQRRFIDNGGVALCIETFGHGPRVLLFLHGWICSRRMWYDVVERLDPETFTAHLLDVRGAGLSDRPMAGHDLPGYASDVQAAIEAIGRPLGIVGHSMGGKLAQYVAATQPALPIERLILVAPGTPRGGRMTETHRERTRATYGNRAAIERFQRGAMKREVPHETMERIVDDALIAQPEMWFDWYERGRPVDFSDVIPAIRVPTLILAGELDPLQPPRILRRHIAEAIPGSIVVELLGCGHNLPVEAPVEVAGAIERFAGERV